MIAATRRRSESHIESATLAVGTWQKLITDNPYNPDADEQRLNQQQRLATAALSSGASTVDVILDQANGQIPEAALEAMPTLDQPIMAHEIVNPNWQTDSKLHSTLTAARCGRAETMEFGWWHLLTLRLLRDSMLPDPPAFLLHRGAPTRLPFDRPSLTADHDQISPRQRKGIDDSIRNLIRHAGGIWHRRGRWLFDAPLAASWWRVEIAQAASQADPVQVSTQGAYASLSHCWRVWADAAARNSTRLAAPNCAAAYVLAAANHRERTGTLPAGAAAKRLVVNLMRRTQHLSVSHVDPQELAHLAA